MGFSAKCGIQKRKYNIIWRTKKIICVTHFAQLHHICSCKKDITRRKKLFAEPEKQNKTKKWSNSHIDIHGRSQTSYITPCDGVISHWAQIGGLLVFANHTRKNKRNTNASTIFAHFTRVYLHTKTAVDAGDIYTHLMNRGYFDYGKKLEDPLFEPHARIKIAQVLGSPVYSYGNSSPCVTAK